MMTGPSNVCPGFLYRIKRETIVPHSMSEQGRKGCIDLLKGRSRKTGRRKFFLPFMNNIRRHLTKKIGPQRRENKFFKAVLPCTQAAGTKAVRQIFYKDRIKLGNGQRRNGTIPLLQFHLIGIRFRLRSKASFFYGFVAACKIRNIKLYKP